MNGPKTANDSVFLEGIRFHAFHGLTKLEREIGVRYKVDVEMKADLTVAAKGDRIADTIDYRKVHKLVVEIGRTESYKLIETLAEHLAKDILAHFPIEEVRVRLAKETPILDGIVDAVGVEVRRRRNGNGGGRQS
jgi:dihydroneopterin aldolase